MFSLIRCDIVIAIVIVNNFHGDFFDVEPLFVAIFLLFNAKQMLKMDVAKVLFQCTV